MSAYETKQIGKKLINAYSDKSVLAAALYLSEDTDIVICGSNERKLLLNTASILPKTTKSTQGVQAMTLKKKSDKVVSVHLYNEGEFEKPYRYRPKNLPCCRCTSKCIRYRRTAYFLNINHILLLIS